MFLAVDTVFDQCSVAAVSKELTVLSCHTQVGKREQTKQILPMIDTVLQEADIKLQDLTALIFNRGPGPFSGIRINTAVIQALSVAHDLPCVGVSSLAAIAQAAHSKYGFTHVYAALDARMKQVYFGQYEFTEYNANGVDMGVMTLVEDTEESLLDYDSKTKSSIPIVGNGAALLVAQESQKIASDIIPTAVDIARLGIRQFLEIGGVPAEEALPVYLRNNAWKTLKEQGKA